MAFFVGSSPTRGTVLKRLVSRKSSEVTKKGLTFIGSALFCYTNNIFFGTRYLATPSGVRFTQQPRKFLFKPIKRISDLLRILNRAIDINGSTRAVIHPTAASQRRNIALGNHVHTAPSRARRTGNKGSRYFHRINVI
jgi:hypothetical protein